MRIGIGYDVHQLGRNRKLILGGVEIPFELGLVGHSDADVLTHSIMDALLGALALGDIGKHFPDSDMNYKDTDSQMLLKKVGELVFKEGYIISNIDSTIMAQEPKLSPFIEGMRENIAKVLKIEKNRISVKATTEEKLGFTGKLEGIKSQAVVLLERKEKNEAL